MRVEYEGILQRSIFKKKECLVIVLCILVEE